MQLAWTESRLNEGLINKRRPILGPDDGDDKTVTILNRLVTWVCLSGSRNQIEIEANPRHREILLAQMNLDGANVKSVTTPAVKMQEWTPQRYVKAPRVDTDTDFAGCVLARKSTTCAHLFHGANLLIRAV